MSKRYSRTEKLIGKEGTALLNAKHIMVFGLGGVGGHCTEALARAGIGKLTLVDNDVVDESNLNRQLFATEDTLGLPKIEAARRRLSVVNSTIEVRGIRAFVLPDNIGEIPIREADLVIDAVDTVTAKIALAERCAELGIPLISSMGTGNKLVSRPLEVTTVDKTSVDPLARVMRRELKKRGLSEVTVVYSKAEPSYDPNNRSGAPASTPYVPGSAGLLLAETAILSLLGMRPLPIPVKRAGKEAL